MNNNYPDDCQGNGRHLPWNYVEPTHENCQECSELTLLEELDEDCLCPECAIDLRLSDDHE